MLKGLLGAHGLDPCGVGRSLRGFPGVTLSMWFGGRVTQKGHDLPRVSHQCMPWGSGDLEPWASAGQARLAGSRDSSGGSTFPLGN